ncbi:hypothetical protein SCP_1700060 [Sparassis crispa]|uniref:Uncharacterized protein n=1 Tax=Sparassis crispa TaxID=139825 RepID=A0A401H5J3_9APHY|nr:hypothetical protein SCP_1700060 [Sparassis crispa]GBE89682.1 hypothetical protein SCP_1700060 [Sparassis crispa]
MNRTIALSGRHYKTMSNVMNPKAHGSVPWRGFTEAMKNIGFKMTATKGSVINFCPPKTMPGRAFCWHKPHSSHLRPDHVRILRGDLSMLYGWRLETFVRK